MKQNWCSEFLKPFHFIVLRLWFSSRSVAGGCLWDNFTLALLSALQVPVGVTSSAVGLGLGQSYSLFHWHDWGLLRLARHQAAAVVWTWRKSPRKKVLPMVPLNWDWRQTDICNSSGVLKAPGLGPKQGPPVPWLKYSPQSNAHSS